MKIEDYARGNRELVRRGVSVLMAVGPEIALKSALAATDTLPIVMLAIDYDPFALGYVTSLVRPAYRKRPALSQGRGMSLFESYMLGAKRV